MYEKKIGTLAKFAGVTSHTIKYYEKEGFFSSIRDSHSNYRFYNLNSCTYLHECIKYRNLGFSVKELNTLCKIANSDTINDMLLKHIDDIDLEIEKLLIKKQMTQSYYQELQNLDVHLNDWFICNFPSHYFLAQTKQLEYLDDYQMEKNNVNLIDYLPYAKSCVCLPKETMEGASNMFYWGQIIEKKYFPEELLKKRPDLQTIGGPKQKAFVAYLSICTKNYTSDGELVRRIQQIYKNFSSDYHGDAYAIRIKIAYEPKETHYFKVFLPI